MEKNKTSAWITADKGTEKQKKYNNYKALTRVHISTMRSNLNINNITTTTVTRPTTSINIG